MIERFFIEKGLRKVELESYLKSELIRAGFTKAEIVKTPMVTRIVLNVTHPGLAIGKGGQNIKALTNTIEKRFKIDNPQIEIKEIKIPELNAQAQADKMKLLLERGFSWRSVAYKVVKDISAAGAQGVELFLAGKLSGKGERKRRQRIFEGYMKKVGEQAKLVDFGMASAYPKAGAIGIKIRIVLPETKFPDKLDLKSHFEQHVPFWVEKAEKVEEESKAEAKQEKEEAIEKETKEEKEAKHEKAGKAEKKEKPEKPETKARKELKEEKKTEKAKEEKPEKKEKQKQKGKEEKKNKEAEEEKKEHKNEKEKSKEKSKENKEKEKEVQ